MKCVLHKASDLTSEASKLLLEDSGEIRAQFKCPQNHTDSIAQPMIIIVIIITKKILIMITITIITNCRHAVLAKGFVTMAFTHIAGLSY